MPRTLGRRADLVGKMVVVDDRVRFYQYHAGRGYDELYLKRTNVVFRLPAPLRPEGSPRPMPVVVQGRLARDRDQLVCDVATLKVLPNDLDRLDQAIAALSARDFENRKAWAAWAEARGKAFKDNALIQRARVARGRGTATGGRAKAGHGRCPEGMARPGRGGTTAAYRRARAIRPGTQGVAGHARRRQQERLAQGDHSSHRTLLSRGGQGSNIRPDRPGPLESGVHERSGGRVPRRARRRPQGASTAGSGPTPSPSSWKLKPPLTRARRSSWPRGRRRNFLTGRSSQRSF